jgi:hypothetical protein
VNVTVRLYVPVRSASLAPIACRNVIVEVALDTGPDQLLGAISTRSGCGRVNAPLVM